MPLEPNTLLGPYEIAALLGEGGMGAVYRARDTRLDRLVAIKLIHKSVAGRFEREARAISALNHPNICTLYDVGPNYLVMELVEGETLAARIKQGPLPIEETMRLCAEILDGMAEAHSRTVIHRDLKPANIMITASGRVKILDFGLAKVLADPDPEGTRTIEGTVLGSFAYMSPEQLMGKDADTRSDIFAFGVILYEMLTGRRAFANAVMREESATLTGIHSELARIVGKCMSKDPDHRYARVEEVKGALEQISIRALAAKEESPKEASKEPSIAVLPFANLSADKENEYFSDGLAEEILNALTCVPGLKVTARTSAFVFRGEKQDIRKIGDTLGVRTVLEGSVRRAGNRIRVSVQLVNASDGYRLWSERYDREMTDVFAVQDEISQAIVNTLKVQLGGGTTEGRPAAMGQTTNVEAYQAYLKGRYHLFKFNPEDLARAKTSLEEAIALDPNYAPAHAMLARYYGTSIAFGLKPVQELAPLAKAATRRAVELNEIDPAAHANLAALAANVDYDWKEALRQCQIALSCGPISPEDRANCALNVLINLRRFDEAIAVVQPALASDPLSPLPRIALAIALFGLGSYERAIEELRRVIELQDDLWFPHGILSGVYTAQGKMQEAIAAAEKGVQVAPWNSGLIGNLAGLYARAGDRAKADSILARLAASPQTVLRTLGYAFFYIFSSDFDRAADELEKVIEARHPMAASLASNPAFEEFRKTPRGRGLLEKVNLAHVVSGSAEAAQKT